MRVWPVFLVFGMLCFGVAFWSSVQPELVQGYAVPELRIMSDQRPSCMYISNDQDWC